MDDRSGASRERQGTEPEGADTSPETGRPGVRGVAPEILPPGTVVGRFIVHRALGAGGTGVVYAAHDPELDRTIALKLLRGELVGRPDARARFLREAQALARLSHPNIIAVYDVGATEGRAFIAMEYIHGQTFAAWTAERPRSWSEVLAVLVKAGHGLAAAHAAGIVHRDFKPANLLIGIDGRVVVTDFGLARAVAEADPDALAEAEEALPRSSAFRESITRTGVVQGTPAYMAPEQVAGLPSDARADQFGYCVTLYEALFREHPFDAPPTTASVARAPRQAGGAPMWLRRAALRGLAGRPEDRHPSMDHLLIALVREPARRRRRIRAALLAAAGAATAGAVWLGLASRADGVESCTGGRDQIAAVWNRSAAARVTSAFMGTGRPHAASSASRIAARLDAYAGEWSTLHRATCLATARGEQSADLLDRRMACLGRHLGQVGALVELFATGADAKVVDDALDVVGHVEPPSACADAAALLARVGPPADPARRAKVVELERQTDRAELERQAGRAQAAADQARAVLDADAKLGHAPLAAQAGQVLGRALEELNRPAEAREALFRAHGMAERAGDEKLAAILLVDLMTVVGLREQRHAEADVLARLAEGALDRAALRDDAALRARTLEALGALANDEGHADRALELQGEVLAIRRRSGASPLDLASTESMLGGALSAKGRSAEARAHYAEALAIRRRVLGDDHPAVAMSYGNVGATWMEEQGNAAEARPSFLAALAILERTPEHRAYAGMLGNLGSLEAAVGNLQEGLRYQEAALAVRLRQLGPDHPSVATTLHNLGDVHHDLGDLDRALDFHRRALAIREKKLGAEHPSSGQSLGAIGGDLLEKNRPAEALPYLDRALRILDPAMGTHIFVGYALANQGAALVELGRRREAIPKLERALSILPPAFADWAVAAFGLARALEPSRPRSERARSLARQALQVFTDLHATHDRDRVAAYLARGAP